MNKKKYYDWLNNDKDEKPNPIINEEKYSILSYNMWLNIKNYDEKYNHIKKPKNKIKKIYILILLNSINYFSSLIKMM